MYFTIKADIGGVNNQTYNWIDIYNPAPEEGIPETTPYVTEATLNKSFNEAGSLTFTIGKEHPYYYQPNLKILGTTIILRIGGNYIAFVGRPIRISVDFMLNKRFECEGALTWLGDIIARPFTRMVPTGGDARYVKPEDMFIEAPMNYSQYMEKIESEYNRANPVFHTIRRSYKRSVSFNPNYLTDEQVGILGIYKDSTTGAIIQNEIFGAHDDYSSCLDVFRSMVDSDSNAVFYTTYTFDNQTSTFSVSLNVVNSEKIHQNWTQASAKITLHGDTATNLRANLIDTGNDIDGNDIYTSIIPLGKDKVSMSDSDSMSGIDFLDSPMAGGDGYGMIEKVQDFSDVECKTVRVKYTCQNVIAGTDPEQICGRVSYDPREDGLPLGDTCPFCGGSLSNALTETEVLYDFSVLTQEATTELNRIMSKEKELQVRAVDLSIIDTTQAFIDISNIVEVVDALHGISGLYIVTSMDIDLLNDDAGSYTLYPKGSPLSFAKKSSVTKMVGDNIQGKGDIYTNKTEYASEAAPEQLIKVNDGYVKAIGKRWTNHYQLTGSSVDDEYYLRQYRTHSSGDNEQT